MIKCFLTNYRVFCLSKLLFLIFAGILNMKNITLKLKISFL